MIWKVFKRRYTVRMKPKTFNELRPALEKAINERLKLEGAPHDPQGFTLLDGFFTFGFQTELTTNLTVGGPSLTHVAIVGNSSGIVYYYAIKALLSAQELGNF